MKSTNHQFVLTFSLLMLLQADFVFSQDAVWVTGHGEAIASNITPEAAKRKALENARRNAIAQLGIEVQSFTTLLEGSVQEQVFNSFSRMIQTRTKGIIVEQRNLQYRRFWRGASPGFKAEVEVKVVLETGDSDPNFQLDLKLNNSTFREGEIIVVDARSTKDCYLH